MLKFALFEIPDADSTAEERARRSGGRHRARSATRRSASLYDEINALSRAARRGALHRPAGAELATTDVIPVPLRGISLAEHGPHLRRQARAGRPDLPTALGRRRADRRRRAKGTPGSTAGSHFTRVLTILQRVPDRARARPGLRPGAAGHRPPGPARIADRAPAAVSELFDDAYGTLLLVLMRFFAHSDERTAELTGLQRAAFFPMMTTAIRPLGELLTLLPTGPIRRADRRPGVPLHAQHHAAAASPRRRWTVIQGELDAPPDHRGPLRGQRLSGGGPRRG